MFTEKLKPCLELLGKEYVLVQAWKKTVKYIRYHNWFSDTLALDHVAINLPKFLAELHEQLESSRIWQSKPLRIVPAPKSQRWQVSKQTGLWGPVKKKAIATRLRPLAHVNLTDQVIASAIMLCMADRVETIQGDPRYINIEDQSKKRIISYGNRLYCDDVGGELRHRWGSSKLYRSYYQDYRTFLSRPQNVCSMLSKTQSKCYYVIHTDLRQFYDRVHPSMLAHALEGLVRGEEERNFFEFVKSVFNWFWESRDEREVRGYAKQAGLGDFTNVVLPQGLVASGFFANVVLLSFDEALRKAIGNEISAGILVMDACRYVDDLRIVVALDCNPQKRSEEVKEVVCSWLKALLTKEASGLELSTEKTKIASLIGDERPLVRQSSRMSRIQAAVSGGFDAIAGEEILDAIQGLMRAQEALSMVEKSGWRFSPMADVRDETVARFSAARFRTTFRSVRPLLEDEALKCKDAPEVGLGECHKKERSSRTRSELDEDARAFALGLIQRWVQDPSNIRLLRIGFDLWPDVIVLNEILFLLRPFTKPGGPRNAPRRVAWYCLSELLRAGAIETGIVPDCESLPSSLDLQKYRETLREEAARLIDLPAATIPWYLRQQALFFLAAFDPTHAPVVHTGKCVETRQYRELIRFLRGEGDKLRSGDFATLAVLARRAFVNREKALSLTRPALNSIRLRQIVERDPTFALEIIEGDVSGRLFNSLPSRQREDLCKENDSGKSDCENLANIVRREHPVCSLRNELSLLRFAKCFLLQLQQKEKHPDVITPGKVELTVKDDAGVAEITKLQIQMSRTDPAGSLYQTPNWCEKKQRWRFHLGYLLRFILTGQPDFTRPVRFPNWKEEETVFRPLESHWYQRIYGMFNGQPTFGDDWLPITNWMEQFLLALFRWPGCRAQKEFDWVEQNREKAIEKIEERIVELEGLRGRATNILIMPMEVKRPTSSNSERPLRACVVQAAIPKFENFHQNDLSLDNHVIRMKHRNHLSATIAAVERMLTLRETHKGSDGRLDWLILPELSVHPLDVQTHLIPFARAHKAIILAGLTYERVIPNKPLINSALWIIPEWSETHGLQIKTRRQGKKYLAPDEQIFNSKKMLLQGFRPCQWLVGYPWTNKLDSRPLWLTATVCYDATDLGIVTDLRDVSDVLAIPAHNKDVKTFDQMAQALHYHMFQLVVVANNGEYGGSNAYWPRPKEYVRQVFHTHGQPQVSISFFEIDKIEEYLQRHDLRMAAKGSWKYPPAGVNTHY